MELWGEDASFIDKVRITSKYILVICLPILTLFLLVDYYEASHLYKEPVDVHFEEVRLHVSGGGKSPATIILVKDGSQVFFSPCDGLVETICSRKEYWDMAGRAKTIHATELSPRNGVVRRVEFTDERGNVTVIENATATNYIERKQKTTYPHSQILLFFCCLATLVFVLSGIAKKFSRRNQKQ